MEESTSSNSLLHSLFLVICKTFAWKELHLGQRLFISCFKISLWLLTPVLDWQGFIRDVPKTSNYPLNEPLKLLFIFIIRFTEDTQSLQTQLGAWCWLRQSIHWKVQSDTIAFWQRSLGTENWHLAKLMKMLLLCIFHYKNGDSLLEERFLIFIF